MIPLRVKRRVFFGDVESEVFNSDSRELPTMTKGKEAIEEKEFKPIKRIPRLSNAATKTGKANVTTMLPPKKEPETTKKPLIKKPIPKFNELDSYDDFQSKVMLSPERSDHMDHEDEDFNLDDYDFDAAHDEFSGRGKPLVPRQYKGTIKKEFTRNTPAPSKNNNVISITQENKDTEVKTELPKKIKKSADLTLGIINIPELVPKSSKRDRREYQKIEKGYNAGDKKDLVGLASREGVYDFVFYKK